MKSLLYDLERDPGETADVAEQHPAVAARMGSELDRWTADVDAAAFPERKRSDDELERLRVLGYVE